MKRVGIAVIIGALLTMLLVPSVAAADTYELFGDAELVSPGNASDTAVQVRSDLSRTNPYGGIDFQVIEGMTFADLTSLSTDYMFEEDDNCGLGSPRFAIEVTDTATSDTGYMFVYVGPPPSWNDCEAGVWDNTGDLLEGTSHIETNQLDGGVMYDTHADALAKFGDYTLDAVFLVMDAGYGFDDDEQTAFFDNTVVNGVLYTYEPATANDLLDQLQEDTAEQVSNPLLSRFLQMPLNLAELAMDRGQTQIANLMLMKYTVMVRLFSFFHLIPMDAANSLIEQAQQIISLNRQQPPQLPG